MRLIFSIGVEKKKIAKHLDGKFRFIFDIYFNLRQPSNIREKRARKSLERRSSFTCPRGTVYQIEATKVYQAILETILCISEKFLVLKFLRDDTVSLRSVTASF